MRTPLRLAASILISELSGALPGKKEKLPLCRVAVPDAAEKTAPAQSAYASAKGKRVKGPSAPIVWLAGGEDPLAIPSVGSFTRDLQNAGHTVFLVTDGTRLRRRIHEFRPNARLYLTVRLYGMPRTHDRRMGKDGAFTLAIEGIRAARLSGFFVCVNVVVDHDTQLHEISQLLDHLCSVNLDGMIITAENDGNRVQRETVAAARGLIGNPWWASFSRLVQLSFDEPGSAVTSGLVPMKNVAASRTHDLRACPKQDATVSSEEVALQ
jgi:hypothetical protein